MTNSELAEAIEFAFQKAQQSLAGGYSYDRTDAAKAMYEHLKALCAEQLRRAVGK